MSINVAGAGLAGLLAANMLARHEPTVWEPQLALPNNHSAVLRFRSGVIGDVVGLPFRRVHLIKHVARWRNPVADALAYAEKNTGTYRTDRSITHQEADDFVRYIAPPDLIARLAAHCDIRFCMGINFALRIASGVEAKPLFDAPIISTVPMPVLMQALEWPDRNLVSFTSNAGANVHATISGCDAYAGITYPDPALPFSRVSITGNSMIIEGKPDMVADEAVQLVADDLGIPTERITAISLHKQKYAKINAIDDDLRKEFIFWATTRHNIYSLGRFATWRPKLLLDDLVKDVRMIERWILKRDGYARRQAS